MIQPTSLFAQILSLVKKTEFARIVEQHKAEYGSKGFSSWTQFISMLFGQFAKCESLREVCNGLNTLNGKLDHLGLSEAPSRSTLAYANENRPWQVFAMCFFLSAGNAKILHDCRKGNSGSATLWKAWMPH